MTPATIALIIQYAIQFGIPAALDIIAMFEKKDPTIEDVKAAFAKSHKSYEEYESLPEGSVVPKLPSIA